MVKFDFSDENNVSTSIESNVKPKEKASKESDHDNNKENGIIFTNNSIFQKTPLLKEIRVNTNIKTKIPNYYNYKNYSIPNRIYFRGTLFGNPFRTFRRNFVLTYSITFAVFFCWLIRPTQEYVDKITVYWFDKKFRF
jgi:hypothetical protein